MGKVTVKEVMTKEQKFNEYIKQKVKKITPKEACELFIKNQNNELTPIEAAILYELKNA